MDRRTFIQAGAALAAVAAAARGARARQPETDIAAFTAARRFVDLPTGRIAYVERGGGPAALFVHGFPLNGYQWRGALDRLSIHRRCIAPDCLGLGYTQPAAGADLRAPAQAEMIAALLDRLGVEEVDVVANDSGCAIAQLLLARHGRRVRSLLLTNGDNEHDCPPEAVRQVIADAKQERFADWFKRWLADKALCRRLDQLGGTFTFPERLSDEAIEMYLAPLADNAARTNAYGRAAEGNPLAGISAALSRSRIPVRILWGTGDTIFKPEGAAYWDGVFPGSRGVRQVAGARLFFPEEFPDLVAEEARVLWGV